MSQGPLRPVLEVPRFYLRAVELYSAESIRANQLGRATPETVEQMRKVVRKARRGGILTTLEADEEGTTLGKMRQAFRNSDTPYVEVVAHPRQYELRARVQRRERRKTERHNRRAGRRG